MYMFYWVYILNFTNNGHIVFQMDELFKNKTLAAHVAAGSGSAALGTAFTYPIDTLKTLVQV